MARKKSRNPFGLSAISCALAGAGLYLLYRKWKGIGDPPEGNDYAPSISTLPIPSEAPAAQARIVSSRRPQLFARAKVAQTYWPIQQEPAYVPTGATSTKTFVKPTVAKNDYKIYEPGQFDVTGKPKEPPKPSQQSSSYVVALDPDMVPAISRPIIGMANDVVDKSLKGDAADRLKIANLLRKFEESEGASFDIWDRSSRGGYGGLTQTDKDALLNLNLRRRDIINELTSATTKQMENTNNRVQEIGEVLQLADRARVRDVVSAHIQDRLSSSKPSESTSKANEVISRNVDLMSQVKPYLGKTEPFMAQTTEIDRIRAMPTISNEQVRSRVREAGEEKAYMDAAVREQVLKNRAQASPLGVTFKRWGLVLSPSDAEIERAKKQLRF